VPCSPRSSPPSRPAGTGSACTDAIEAALTYFRDTSELERVNREAGARPVAVSAELFALLTLCRAMHAASDGAFDPTTASLSRGWGFRPGL